MFIIQLNNSEMHVKHQNDTKTRLRNYYSAKGFYFELKMNIYIKIKKVIQVTAGM